MYEEEDDESFQSERERESESEKNELFEYYVTINVAMSS